MKIKLQYSAKFPLKSRSVQLAVNVSRLSEVADESEPSFLCQDKTIFVKTKFPVTENQQSRLSRCYQ